MPRLDVIWHLLLRASGVRRKRAILTVAAIAWGALALILLLAFGEGLKRQMYAGQTGLGNDIAILWPGETGRPWKGMPAGRPIRPRIEDIALLDQQVEHLEGVLGEIRRWRVPLTWGERTVNARVTATTERYRDMRKHEPQRGGRFINPRDLVEKRRVVFLGNELAEEIFGDHEPVGEMLLVDQVPYTVIGVMRRKYQQSTYGGPDADHALIPLTTFQAQYGRDRLSDIVVKPDRPDRMPLVLERIHEVLGAKYGFDPADERVFPTWDTVESARMTMAILLGLELFLGIIGGLTLVIGGVGVANIMYAVVKERTRQIGVMMALGARRRWLVWPVVLEACLYTFIGGLLGLAMGVGVITLFNMIPLEGNEVMEMLGHPKLSLPIGLATAGVLGLIGVLAGYFPARRAASVQPAETLRHE